MRDIKSSEMNYILTKLVEIFGLYRAVDKQLYYDLAKKGNIEKCIELICQRMKLQVSVTVQLVSNKYKTQNSVFGYYKDGKRNRERYVVAHIKLPRTMPLYGTNQFEKSSYTIYISRNYSRNPETIIILLIHELSHLLLHSLYHQKRESEIWTDLTGMVFGYYSVFRDCRTEISREYFEHDKIRTKTTTYGYLSDDEFNLAFNIIQFWVCDYEKDLDSIKQYHKKIDSYIKYYTFLPARIINYVTALKKRKYRKKIRGKDNFKLIECYSSKFYKEIEEIRKELLFKKKFIGNLVKKNYRQFQKYDSKYKTVVSKDKTELEGYMNYNESIQNRYKDIVRTFEKYTGKWTDEKHKIKYFKIQIKLGLHKNPWLDGI